jgi:hypothetical protein
MYTHQIKNMVEALQVAGLIPMDKNAEQEAVAVLEDYWTKRIGIVWEIDDIFHQAKVHGRLLTEEDAIEVLYKIQDDHDATIGVNWDTIDYYVLDYPTDPNNPNPYEDDDDEDDDDELGNHP